MSLEPARRSTARPHLITPEALAEGSRHVPDNLTRHHGQGNGLRVHGIYFAVVSLAALVVLLVLAATAAARI